MTIEIKTQSREKRRVGVLVERVFHHAGVERRGGCVTRSVGSQRRAEAHVHGSLGHPEVPCLPVPDALALFFKHDLGHRCVRIRERQQINILCDERVHLGQSEFFTISTGPLGKQDRLGPHERKRHLVVGRDSIRGHLRRCENNLHSLGHQHRQGVVNEFLVETLHTVRTTENVLIRVVVHRIGQATDIADRRHGLAEAECECCEGRLLVITPFLCTGFPKQFEECKNLGDDVLVVRNTLFCE